MTDYTAKLEAARQRLPLRSLMEKYGHGPSNGNWKTFPKCPFCDGGQCAGVFSGTYGDLFKCHRPSCSSGTADDKAAWDEIGFLAFKLKMDRREATLAWLKEAGISTEAEQKLPDRTKSNHESIPDQKKATEVGGGSPAPEIASEKGAPLPSPLEAFVERASLCDADRQLLKTNRGLSDEMINGAGFLTNDLSNLAILNALALEYPEWQLVKCGLFRRREKSCKPSGQFYGFGVIGKKKRLSSELLESGDYDDVDDDEFVWGQKESGLCNPILIPYFDLSGELAGLRPHKGFPRGQKPRLYLAGGRMAPQRCKQAVIVEGEFKAAALQDVVGKDWAVASVPGITQVKNLHVWADILNWLKQIGAQTVVVVFDNEEHGDPKLPSFRPQLENRFEAEIWARVCAVRLGREGYEARVGYLPEEWRDNNGKADWDSALAAMRQTGKSPSEIRLAFTNILQSATRISELAKAKVHEATVEQIITDRVAVRTYEPALPWGGAAERKLAEELRKLAAGKLREWHERIIPLAEAFEATSGWYYELRISEQRREKLLVELQAAEGMEQILFLKLSLKGTPSLVAPFRVQPYHVLLKPDGGRDRLVRLINIRGERSELLPLDANSFTAARDWRRWLASAGNYGWEKGDGPLQALQRDINFKMARREVLQQVCYGCERPGKLWFLDDCAYAEDGTLIQQDEEGIIWHHGCGYTFLRDQEKIPRGEEGQSFRLKIAPRMHPNLGLVCDPSGKLCLQAGAKDDLAALQELLENFVAGLNDSYGGFDGLMLIAATMAYYGGPELYKLRGEFPGIWITGEKGSGKTYTAKWLAALHGFSELEAGLSFKTSSAVGAQIALGQYANQPVWGDEFRENELKDFNIKGVVHGGFNREVPSKYSPDGRVRTIRTNFLVTGETTCNNPATMSRFVSAVASRKRRRGSSEEQLIRFNWLQDHRKLFFAIGRAVLQQRGKFAARMMEHFLSWDRLPALAQAEPRGRLTYGAAYAAFLALDEIIPLFSEPGRTQFRDWMVEKTITSSLEISERVEVNQFWKILSTMHATAWFGKTPEDVGRFFKILANKRSRPQLSELQLKAAAENPRRALEVPCLALRPDLIFPLINEFMRNQGGPLPPSQADIQAQLRVHSYFVPGPAKGHAYKFGHGATTNSYCWVIDLVHLPEHGLREVSDETWEASFYRGGDKQNCCLPSNEWVDPRKGELFGIVDALKEKE